MAEGDEADQNQSLTKMGIRAPRSFDPKKDKNFINWLKRLDYHFGLIKLQEDQKTAALLCYLDSDAFEIANNLGIIGTTAYADACKLLKEQYAITETVEEMREKFSQRRQIQGETLDTFARDLRMLANRAFEKVQQDVLEILLIKQFIDGARDITTKERLMVKRPATLTEAVHFARLSEMAVTAARGSQSKASSVSSVSQFEGQSSQRNYSPPNRQQNTFGYNQGNDDFGSYQGYNNFGNIQRYNTGGYRTDFRGYNNQGNFNQSTYRPQERFQYQASGYRSFQGKCFYCGRYGHKETQCRQKFSQQRGNTYRGFSASTSEETSKTTEDQPSQPNSEPDVSNSIVQGCSMISNKIFATKTKGVQQARRKLFVKGKLNGKVFAKILVDSGSMITLCSTDFWKKITNGTEKLNQVEGVFSAANNLKLDVRGSFQCRIQIGGLDVLHKVYVADHVVHEFLLGDDFLNEYHCDILYCAGSIVAGSRSVPFEDNYGNENSIESVLSVFLSEETVIPPMQVIHVIGEVSGSENFSDDPILVEPVNFNESRLVPARLLVSSDSVQVPIPVANLGPNSAPDI